MSYPTLAYSSLEEWLEREAIPFSLEPPEVFNAAVDRLIAALDGSVELLGLGEALHGGEEILMLRNRLFRRLVEAHGYRAIAVESSFPRSRIVNEFVAGRGAKTYAECQETGFSHGFGRLEANRELVEWMRDYNAGASVPARLRFYGFDSPTEMMFSDSPREVLHFVLEYLDSVESAGNEKLRERIEPLLGEDAVWENPGAAMDPTQSVGRSPAATALRIEAEDLLSELQRRREELVAKGDESRYLEAVHYGSIARWLLDYHAEVARPSEDRVARLLGMRDALMAENLTYIVSRERGGRVLAFAHNSHLQRGMARWQWGEAVHTWRTVGSHLEEMLGSRYANIGTAIGLSDANGIGLPEAGTFEALLTSAPGPARFVPTYKGQAVPPAAISDRPIRSGSARNPTYFALTPQSFSDFDTLAILDTTGYNRGGPPLQ